MKTGTALRKDEAYDCSTDIDSEEEAESRLKKWSEETKVKYTENLPPLPDLFKNSTFYLCPDLPEHEMETLSRYTIAYGG